MICGKIVYATKREAIEATSGVIRDNRVRTHKSKKKPVRSYYCTDCNGWHLTSKVKTSKGNKHVKVNVSLFRLKPKQGGKLKIKVIK